MQRRAGRVLLYRSVVTVTLVGCALLYRSVVTITLAGCELLYRNGVTVTLAGYAFITLYPCVTKNVHNLLFIKTH